MSFSEKLARSTAAASRWALRNVFHRDAANFPGKIGLYLDPSLIAHAARNLACGSLCVVGTNGKTTTTNLICNALEASGATVCCNKTGANLDSGVASALLEQGKAQWAVLECDELWLSHILPQLQANYVLLLNLFRDQLDRAGEIELVQESIVSALKQSPRTTLIYNADDPLCAAIARKAPNKNIAFGVQEDLHLQQNSVVDAQICQNCAHPLTYEFHQYGQLGKYRCPFCGFARPALDYAVDQVVFGSESVSFRLIGAAGADTRAQANSATIDAAAGSAAASECNAGDTSGMIRADRADHTESPHYTAHNTTTVARGTRDADTGESSSHYCAPFPSPYMVYNLAAAAVASRLLGCAPVFIQQAMSNFSPQNGRLERLTVQGHPTLINLAKNPTGMNQNLRIALADSRPFVLGIFINDKEADGHDVSWLWDVDFEELVTRSDIRVFAGGIRKYDLQVRLKYAGVQAELVNDASELAAYAKAEKGKSADEACPIYAIANYTALPEVKAALEKHANTGEAATNEHGGTPAKASKEAITKHPAKSNPASANSSLHANAVVTQTIADSVLRTNVNSATQAGTNILTQANINHSAQADANPLVIVHIFPKLLNLYGDRGNVIILKKRLEWRDIPVEVRALEEESSFDLSDVDLVFLGGAPDREQEIAQRFLQTHTQELATFIESGGACLAICGGYQMLGRNWILNGKQVPGLSIGAFETRRAGTAHDRLVGNISLQVNGIPHPVVGYENHAGRTFLDQGNQAFGQVVSKSGHGNNDTSKADGYRAKNLVGTYLHGPLLAKNPELADWLLQQALGHWAQRTNRRAPALSPLDNTAELRANQFMAGK